ncbi:hypothetical protein BYT27DRAFT_7225459 [Phlegmacium glaucopus]|nr:hypothetical protein BYT27DRAFT_7225459 [Phlegmacium glaucopus]
MLRPKSFLLLVPVLFCLFWTGDFAQLPPTHGSPLYSNIVPKTQNYTMSKRDQESTIGKILWHQITTVVILTQNMRQTEISGDDQKFRSTLSNMRYAACTKDDLTFLQTLVVNKNGKDKTLTDPNFRNVSVITSLNTQKDQINDLGTQRSKKASADVNIPINIQQILWNCSPHSSEHFPGLPVMIRNNDATELCITKGQEAYIIGWDAIEGPQKQNVLETLYLELKNPPKPIQLPHLPKNIIPMTKTTKTVKCRLPNDCEINIIRQQVNVLQGKTCLYNVVNLSHCQNFQSISSAAGTLIIQSFI